jgi:hypothetical protein
MTTHDEYRESLTELPENMMKHDLDEYLNRRGRWAPDSEAPVPHRGLAMSSIVYRGAAVT